MRRLLIIAAAAATLAVPVVGAAQGRADRDYSREDRYERSESRQGGRYTYRERQESQTTERRYEERVEPRDSRGGSYRERGLPQYEPRGEVRRYQDPRNALPPLVQVQPRAQSRAGVIERSWGRGERLPPMYRGGVVRDPGRFRLRTPPPGYDWVGVGPDIYLVQRSTGLVLDAIPGGY